MTFFSDILERIGLASKRRVNALVRRIETIEKRQIVDSGFWDPLWYVRTYGHDMTRAQALDHWYRTGWREGENPSPHFDVAAYLPYLSPGENPLIAYLNPWRLPPFQPHKGNVPPAHGDRRVAAYLAAKTKRQARGVIYTCITGGYDDLHDVSAYGYVAPEWDYVCFSDDPALVAEKTVGIWEVRPLAFAELDGTRNNRWHKTHPHVLFPDAAESIYIDANIDILSPVLFEDIDGIGASIALPRHFDRQCVYSEFDIVLKRGMDDRMAVERLRRGIEASGMPRNYGLAENNILYRRHHEPGIVDLDEAWWKLIRDSSKRDQLSLMWLFWKRGWKVEDVTFENARLRPGDFYVFGHRGGANKGS